LPEGGNGVWDECEQVSCDGEYLDENNDGEYQL
jgi:hypothetical protein